MGWGRDCGVRIEDCVKSVLGNCRMMSEVIGNLISCGILMDIVMEVRLRLRGG